MPNDNKESENEQEKVQLFKEQPQSHLKLKFELNHMKLYVEKDTGYVDNSENKIEQQFQ